MLRLGTACQVFLEGENTDDPISITTGKYYMTAGDAQPPEFGSDLDPPLHLGIYLGDSCEVQA